MAGYSEVAPLFYFMNVVRSLVNYAIFRELCDQMRFEVDCAKSHHCNHKCIPTQLGVAGSLLPKTIRDAPHNREVNRKKILRLH